MFGKTTIMRILQNLMNFNFKELIKYDFESIDIEVTAKNGKILKDTIRYEDLLPTNEEIKNLVIKSHFFLYELSDEWDCYIDSVSDEEKIKAFDDNSMTDEEKIELWNDFDFDIAYQEAKNGEMGVLSNELLNDLIDKNEFKNIMRKIIKNEEFDDVYFNNYINEIKYNEQFGYEFKYSFYKNHVTWEFNDVKDTLKKIIETIKEYIENLLKCNKEIKFINEKNITKILNILMDSIDKPVNILDMTKVYNFSNELLPSSLLTNELMDWKSSAPSNYIFIDDLELNICNHLLEIWDWEDGFLTDSSKDISELNNDIIDINSIIKHYFYNMNFIIDINKKALKYYVDFKNNAITVSNEIEDLTIIKDIFLKYIRPIIIKNSPFDTDWTAYVFQNHQVVLTQKQYTNIFCNLCEKLSNSYKDNINPKMKILQELLDKYLMNKNVEVTPMGLLIKSKGDNLSIPLNSLSSGEKKIIVIFLHCLFNEDVPIIIDEPEISLSIIWQENLLPDLLEKTPIKQVIVATHSSAIISNSILDKYIIPLPNSIIDRGDNTNE